MEFILRILDFFGSFWRPQHPGYEEKKDLTPIDPEIPENNLEELTLILTKNQKVKNTLSQQCLLYVFHMEGIRETRLTRDYGHIRDEKGYIPLPLINSYNNIMDDIWKQTTYESLILTKFIAEGHINFKKHAEELQKGWYKFDRDIYHKACREICAYYREVVESHISKATH